MNIASYVRLALAAMGSGKLRSALTTLGIVIGVAAVVALVSIGQGARDDVQSRLSTIAPDHVIVIPGGMARDGERRPPARLTTDDTGIIAALDGTLAAASVIEVTALLSTGAGEAVGTVVATEPAALETFRMSLSGGRFLADGEAAVIVLGAGLARELFPEEEALGRHVLIDDRAYIVEGVLAPQAAVMMYDFDRRAYVGVADAEPLGARPDPGHIAVRASGHGAVAALTEEITGLMAERHPDASLTVIHQQAMLDAVDSILTILTGVLTGVASISLVVGGIGIMNIMLATVTERTREIGIRKAVGARDRDIMIQFLVEASVLSVLGGLIGIGLGAGGAALAARLIRGLPVAIPAWGVALAFTFSLAVGLMFGVWPAARAARMDPVAALRYE